jgi:hypothetical protein
LSGKPARNKIQAGRNESQIQRNEIQIGRNKIQIRRNKIQTPFRVANPDLSTAYAGKSGLARPSIRLFLRRPPDGRSGLDPFVKGP